MRFLRERVSAIKRLDQTSLYAYRGKTVHLSALRLPLDAIFKSKTAHEKISPRKHILIRAKMLQIYGKGRIRVPRHQCYYCPKLFIKPSDCKAHMRIHTGEKPYACIYCDYRSVQKSNLKTHLRKKHDLDENKS